MKAIWNGQILAESDKTVVIENNHYFPADSTNKEFFKSSEYKTSCPWKGTASYDSIEVNGETNTDAAWHYPETKGSAKVIEGYYAFWKGVEIVD
ncbi:MAG: hypothetical protein ACI9UR_001828 [Bacteroidia bacterium]|jgi:uncharacterized protein (DUF427 family)